MRSTLLGSPVVLSAARGSTIAAVKHWGSARPAPAGRPTGQVSIDQLALLFALVVSANLVILIALQLPRRSRRSAERSVSGDTSPSATGGAQGDLGPDSVPSERRGSLWPGPGQPAAVYQRMARVVSFMFIGTAMVIEVLVGASNEGAVIVLLAFGLILVELFQDILPPATLGRWRLPIEAAAWLVFITVLLVMTGGQASPYFFGYILLIGAAALSTAGIGTAVLAVVTSLAYLTAIAVGGAAPFPNTELGLIAFNLISITLVMYVASVIGREQRRARDEALRLSRYDFLTGLFSRAAFTSELEQEILRATRTGRSFAVAMVDLDGLKAANDRFGHEWGDNLLRAVSEVLKGDIRATDVGGRLGGDEFALLLPETDLAGAILVGEKVRADISRVALPHNGSVIRTTASIGIVMFPDDGRSAAELMRRADQAMYEAKRRGRDQIVHIAREGGTPGAPQPVIQASPTAPPRPAARRSRGVPPASAGPAPWETA